MSYRNAFLVLILVQVCFLASIIFKGEVIFPHDNVREVLGSPDRDSRHMSNRKFTDQSRQFIPTLHQHLAGNSKAWIAVWDPSVQLGRPAGQRGGLGKACIITHALSFFSNDALVVYTLLTALTIFLTGIFMFLLLQSLGLSPLTCFVAGIGLSTGVFFSYWITFIMFLSVRCWTVCLLWLIKTFIDRQSFLKGLGISFAVYSLFMTGYPQSIIVHLYLMLVFATVCLWKSSYSLSYKGRIVMLLALCGVMGCLTALPVYLDAAVRFSRSARTEVSDAFFLANLPKVRNVGELLLQLGLLFDAFWFGNPITNYPVEFNGLSFGPLYLSLFAASFANGQWRKLWPLQVFCVLCFIATTYPPAYLFAVHYLGFCFSRCTIWGGTLIPVYVLAGFAIDHITRNKLNWSCLGLLVLPLLIVGIPRLVSGAHSRLGVQLPFAVLSCGIVAGLVAFGYLKRNLILYALAICSVFAYGFRMQLTRPRDSVQLTSPLIGKIQSVTQGNFRYAKAGLGRDLLMSNQESLFGIRSIHSYDSLSSRNYQRLVKTFCSHGTSTYGRYFDTMGWNPGLDNADFSYSGVKLIVSGNILRSKRYEYAGNIGRVRLYLTSEPPLLAVQTHQYITGKGEEVTFSGELSTHEELPVKEIVHLDDFRQYTVTKSSEDTILFVSQQYHPQWKARSGSDELETVIVNDFYQGVIVPATTNNVELEFKPYVLWSWVPQVFYLLVFGFIGLSRLGGSWFAGK